LKLDLTDNTISEGIEYQYKKRAQSASKIGRSNKNQDLSKYQEKSTFQLNKMELTVPHEKESHDEISKITTLTPTKQKSLNAREKEIKFLEENVVGINKQLKKNILNKYKPKETLNLEERL